MMEEWQQHNQHSTDQICRNQSYRPPQLSCRKRGNLEAIKLTSSLKVVQTINKAKIRLNHLKT